MKVLGDRLQKVRQHLKMKQSEVAEEVGCAPLTISRMERGETSTSLLPLLAFYSQSISMDLLFAKAFDPEDEALYSKDPALESHVKARLQLLQSDATEYIKNLQKEYDVNVFIIMRGELTVLATDNTVLKQGDIIIINSNTLVKKKKHGK